MAAFRSFFCAVTLLLTGACVSVPSAFTVGQSTVHVKRHPHEMDRYLTEIHEAAHRRQYREHGIPSLLWSYALRPSKRLRMEAEAHATALCKAAQLGVGPNRLNRIHERYAAWLRSYAPDKPITEEAGRTYLDAAYQNGDACAALLESLDTVPLPAAYAQTRVSRPAPDRAAPVVILASPMRFERSRPLGGETPLVLPRVPTPSLAPGPSPSFAPGPRIIGFR